MKTPLKILIVAVLAVLVVGAVALKKGKTPVEANIAAPASAASVPTPAPAVDPTPAVDPPLATATAAAVPAPTARLPRLVDLGADRCIPCKMMKPILDEFQRDYADRFVTEFIDVWKNPDAGKQYGIRVIPTQIFYDAEGKERFRHEGFYGKEDMLAKWRELGVDLAAAAPAPATN
jgi:thioredoxin 1